MAMEEGQHSELVENIDKANGTKIREITELKARRTGLQPRFSRARTDRTHPARKADECFFLRQTKSHNPGVHDDAAGEQCAQELEKLLIEIARLYDPSSVKR